MKKLIAAFFVVFAVVAMATPLLRLMGFKPPAVVFASEYSLGLLNGSTQYVSLPFTSSSDFTSGSPGFGISAWFKPTAAVGQYIVSNYGGGAGAVGVFLTNGDKIQFFIRADSVDGIFTTTNSVSASAWNHVYVDCDGTKTAAGIKIYLNGVDETVIHSAGPASWTGSAATGVGYLVGRLQTISFAYFTGYLDEIAYYSTSSPARAAGLYNSGTPSAPTATNRVMWRQFDNDLTDEDGGGAGTAFGGAGFSTDVAP